MPNHRSPLGSQAACQVCTRIPTSKYGEYYVFLYTTPAEPQREHLAIVFGTARYSRSLARNPSASLIDELAKEPPPAVHQNGRKQVGRAGSRPPLVRVHSECFTGETLLSSRCDCGEQLHTALSRMAAEKDGILIYLRQEGRGIGLLEKLKAYNIQDHGFDTVQANAILGHPIDARTYNIAQEILEDLQVARIRLMTNNPAKVAALEFAGIEVTERVEMVPKIWQSPGHESARENSSDLDKYLVTKVHSMGHKITVPIDVNTDTDRREVRFALATSEADPIREVPNKVR